jgi:hypothetical protein
MLTLLLDLDDTLLDTNMDAFIRPISGAFVALARQVRPMDAQRSSPVPVP